MRYPPNLSLTQCKDWLKTKYLPEDSLYDYKTTLDLEKICICTRSSVILNGHVKYMKRPAKLKGIDKVLFPFRSHISAEKANLTVITVKNTAYFYSNMAPKREKDLVYPF